MKRLAITLVLVLVACRKDEPPSPGPTPVTVTSAGTAPAPVLLPVETTVGARVDVPPGFTIEPGSGNDMTIRIPAGGKVKLSAMGACGLSLERMCKRMSGTMNGSTCEEPHGRTRLLDGVFHSIAFDGDVPAGVRDSWSPPLKTAGGFYCAPSQLSDNAAEE